MDNKLKRNLMLIGLTVAVLGIIALAFGNVIEESFYGTGNMDTSHRFQEASDDASVRNASGVDYSSKTTWQDDETVRTRTMESSFTVVAADPNGGYFNRYVVKSSGAGYKHTYRVYFEGDFSGSAAVTVTLSKSDLPQIEVPVLDENGSETDATEYVTDNSINAQRGAESIDSLFLIDSRGGNATFQGRIVNGQTGRPVTEGESNLVGQFLVRSYLNISKIPEDDEGWLNFCDTLDKSIILDKTAPGGIYILPQNSTKYDYYWDAGQIKRVLKP
jgi:hypothetical protein